MKQQFLARGPAAAATKISPFKIISYSPFPPLAYSPTLLSYYPVLATGVHKAPVGPQQKYARRAAAT